MKKGGIIFLIVILLIPIVLASDVLVWQGQYYTGTTFHTGTYEFNFSVYNDLTGGEICYSNTTTLTTGNWGEWKTEQNGVNAACNNTSEDYFLNIKINGVDQIPRRRLVIWTSLRKDVDEITLGKFQTISQVIAPVIKANSQIIVPLVNSTQIIAPIINTTEVITTNITTRGIGFFNYLGNLINRITKLFVRDINFNGTINGTGNIETSQNISANYFIGDGSLLTSLLVPVYLKENLTATNTEYTTIFNLTLIPSKMNLIQAYLIQSSQTGGVAIQNRVIVNEIGPIGSCNFVTQTGAKTHAVNNIAVSNDSEDTGENTMTLDTDVPFINTITCAISADATQRNLIIQFESELATGNVTTYTGSYYTNAVN